MTDALPAPEMAPTTYPAPRTDVPASARAITRATVWDVAGLAVALLVGAAAAWHNRFLIGADAMSYLDYSDRFLDGTWRAMPNGYWSPGYPAMLALVRALTTSAPAGDSIALRTVGYAGYAVAALGCFWLLQVLHARAADRGHRAGRDDAPRLWEGGGSITLSVLVWSLFTWSAGALTGDAHSTPDTLVSASTFVATAAALRVADGQRDWRSYVAAVALGLALGGGYLIKAVMLPVGLMLGGTLIALQLVRRRDMRPTIVAAIVFVLVALPQVITQSRLAGRPAFGMVGTLVHEWYVGGLPCPLFSEPVRGEQWDDCMLPRTRGAAIAPQPFPRLMRDPSVYYFPQPASATFPAWYDATRWYPSVHPTLHLKTQLVTFAKNLGADVYVLIPFLAAAGAAILLIGMRRGAWREIDYLLLVPSLGTVVIYALSYSSVRYLGPAITLGVLAFAPVALGSARTERARWLGQALAVPAVLLLAAYLAPLVDTLWYDRHATNTLLADADALQAAGLAPGMRVGIIGDGSNAYWARLARVHVIAEVHTAEKNRYWSAPAEKQAQVVDAFRRAGVRAIVGDPPPKDAAALPVGWVMLRSTKPLAIYRM